MDRLSELLGSAVQFVYTCWDRIVLNGYIERLQRPENLIYFFHDVVGVPCIEPTVLQQRTNAYKAWVRRIAEEHDISVLAAPPAPPKGLRKGDFVLPFYRRLKGAEGVACVLTSLEQGRTFVSYTPSWTPPSGDANYRFIKACHKRFLRAHWIARRFGSNNASSAVSIAGVFPTGERSPPGRRTRSAGWSVSEVANSSRLCISPVLHSARDGWSSRQPK